MHKIIYKLNYKISFPDFLHGPKKLWGGGEREIYSLLYMAIWEKCFLGVGVGGGGPLQPPPLMMRAYKIFSRNVAMIIYTVN